MSFISKQSEFTPPIIYSKDSRAKLVFMIEARPAPQDAPRLRPGQPVDVTFTAGASASSVGNAAGGATESGAARKAESAGKSTAP